MVVALPRMTLAELAIFLHVSENVMMMVESFVKDASSHHTHAVYFDLIINFQFWTRHPISNFYEIEAANAKQDVVLWIWRLLGCWINRCADQEFKREYQHSRYASWLFSFPNCVICTKSVFRGPATEGRFAKEFCWECKHAVDSREASCRARRVPFVIHSVASAFHSLYLENVTLAGMPGSSTSSYCRGEG